MGGTATVLHKPDDYDTFVDMMAEASVRVPMPILAYCSVFSRYGTVMCLARGREREPRLLESAGCCG